MNNKPQCTFLKTGLTLQTRCSCYNLGWNPNADTRETKLNGTKKTSHDGKKVATKELKQKLSAHQNAETKPRNIPRWDMTRHDRRRSDTDEYERTQRKTDKQHRRTRMNMEGDRRRRNELMKTWGRTKTLYRQTNERMRNRWKKKHRRRKEQKNTGGREKWTGGTEKQEKTHKGQIQCFLWERVKRTLGFFTLQTVYMHKRAA